MPRPKKPSSPKAPQVAIIGAGIAGIACARTLAQAGMHVTVFEKARGVGGRMSTRYADPFYFNHGAPFFTVQTHSFQQYIQSLIALGVVIGWKKQPVIISPYSPLAQSQLSQQVYGSVPYMNSLCKYLSQGLHLMTNTEVAPVGEKQLDGWHLYDTKGQSLGIFDWLVSTAPPPQTLNLLNIYLPEEVAKKLCAASFLSSSVLMLGLSRECWSPSWDIAEVLHHPVASIMINSARSARENLLLNSVVVHSTHHWALEHIDQDSLKVSDALAIAWGDLVGVDIDRADYRAFHRWRYAKVCPTEAGHPFLDLDLKIASTGDWCGRLDVSEIERAWLSAQSLIQSIRDSFGYC